MRNQLISYVDLLFAGNPEAAEMKQEILQNTLDRYDDLVARGKTPEAAYSLAISGIGDVSELLRSSGAASDPDAQQLAEHLPEEQKKSKLLRAIAVGLYIACPIPLFIFQNEVGLCLLLVVVAAATVLMIFAGKDSRNPEEANVQDTPDRKLRRSIHSAVSTVGLIVYFIVSFLTMAWHLTWLIFPLTGAVNGLITAIMDLKEAR